MIWFGMPPLLKLWIDEVFDMKWLSGPDTSPVKGKAYIVLTTEVLKMPIHLTGYMEIRPKIILKHLPKV